MPTTMKSLHYDIIILAPRNGVSKVEHNICRVMDTSK